MITLANMLLPANVPTDQASVDLIRATLAQGALDSSPYVTETAVAALESTVTLFSTFTNSVETSTKSFELASKFTLGTGSKGISPPSQEVVLSLGSYSVRITANSFHLTSKKSYIYEGTINGVKLEAQILPNTTIPNNYKLTLQGNTPINLSHPAVVLTIGNDMGFGTARAGN
jgi:hypothetical protein